MVNCVVLVFISPSYNVMVSQTFGNLTPLFNSLFRLTINNSSKLYVTGLLWWKATDAYDITEYTKALHYWPFWGKTINDLGIPDTMGQLCKKCSMWWCHHVLRQHSYFDLSQISLWSNQFPLSCSTVCLFLTQNSIKILSVYRQLPDQYHDGEFSMLLGAISIKRCHPTSIGNPTVDIRWHGFHTPAAWHIYDIAIGYRAWFSINMPCHPV